MLRDLINISKSEPISVTRLRRGIILILLSMLTTVFILLCIRMDSEQPVLSTTIVPTDNPLAPGEK